MSGTDHDGGTVAIAPNRVIASWDEGTFVENIAIDADGHIFVTVHTLNAVLRVDPADGSVATFARFATSVAGLAFGPDGTLWVSGGTPGSKPGVIWRVSPDGAVSHWLDVPDALFLNGATLHSDGRRLLVAESIIGAILAVDLTTPRVETWLSDPLLTPVTNTGIPGANGIKLFDSHAYISVTERNLILRAPVLPDGRPAMPEIFAKHLRADDFAIDTDGALYIATHLEHSLVRLTQSGQRHTLAGADEGLAGSTAVAFGRGAADRNCVYVTTNGGMTAPLDGRIQRARLVCVEVGAEGA